jgi:hypothetical protein
MFREISFFPKFLFFVMKMTQLKYTWDIVIERDLTKQQLRAVNEVAKMISFGGEVKEIKQKLAILK